MQRWSSDAMTSRLGGPSGNERLTALTAVVLLVLLAAEGLTIPLIHAHLAWHIFLGLVLVPPVLLKLGSVGWRFARYYLRTPAYIAKGAPSALMRFLVAPLTVVSTLVLFGSGVLLAVLHPQRGPVLAVHKASFIVWFGAMSLHVLGHVLKLPGLAGADLGGRTEGAWLRQVLVACAVVAGVIVAIVALPAAHAWAQWAALPHG
jgi:hypothetical protein